jgi:hypothetical protein
MLCLQQNLVCGLIRKVNFATPDLLTEGRVNPSADERESMPHLFGDLDLRPPLRRSLLLLTQLGTCLFGDLPFWMLAVY